MYRTANFANHPFTLTLKPHPKPLPLRTCCAPRSSSRCLMLRGTYM